MIFITSPKHIDIMSDMTYSACHIYPVENRIKHFLETIRT